jgi:hypothetical protein
MSRGLRIGIVLSGQLVEERLVRTGPITVGQSLRANISVPVDGVPREHTLFGPDLELRLAPGMTGRVAVDGVASAAGDGPIAPHSRGKLELGELTILFQAVAVPAAVPRPRLPAELRGRRIDRRLLAIVGTSLVVHVAIAAWAWTHDIDLGPSFADSYRPGQAIDVQLPDFVDRVDPTTTPAQPGVARPVAPVHSIVPARTPSHAAASDPAELVLEASRMASILTGDDSDHGYGGMSERGPGADLAAQIADARNHHAVIGDGSHSSRVDDRAHIGDGTQHVAENPHYETTTHTAVQPTRMKIVADPHGDRSSPDIVAKIQSVYVAGLQRCYQLALRDNATLEGKVALELTVEANGRVSEPSASGVSDDVDHCIAAQMGSWRFQAPRDEATFQISLILKPGL